jgi:hypothetical protein
MGETKPSTPPPTELIFRETFLSRFERHEDAELWRTAGGFLFRMAVDSEDWGSTRGLGVIGIQLAGAADDLEHLVAYLNEVAEAAATVSVTPAEVRACRKAADWAEHLDRAVKGLREAAFLQVHTGEAEG